MECKIPFPLKSGKINLFLFKNFIVKRFYLLAIFISRLLALFGIKHNIAGSWNATFAYCNTRIQNAPRELITEKIKLYILFDYVIGIYDELGHSRSLRIIGRIVNNSFVTGTWFHRNNNSDHHGAFQLTIQPNKLKMIGKWVGFTSVNMAIINCEEWNWDKVV